MGSPIINKVSPPTMSFGEALNSTIDGDKITKLEWGDDKVYGYIKDGILTLHKNDKDFTWAINDGDIAGEDWIVLEVN